MVSLNIHTRAGFSSAGPKATLTARKVKSYNSYKRNAYIGYRKEITTRYTLRPQPRKTLGTWGAAGWGERGGSAGRRGEWWAGTLLEGTPY